MRWDMYRVVIERPRFGHANRSRKWGGRVDELYEGPKFVSSARRRQYGYESKELSDLINPLIRFLHKQIGRPWNNVYSELKKAVPKGLHADHIWSHVKSAVQIHCWEEDGAVWYLPRYSRRPCEVDGLYVHPRTGFLRLKPERSRQPIPTRAASIRRIDLSKTSIYRNIDGLWYYLEFAPRDPLEDAEWVLIKKKQLNRKELQELHATYPNAA
jgi:hypothetical protein